MRAFCVVLFACAGSALAAGTGPDSDLARSQAALARLPLRFEKNVGQASAPVRYKARAAGYTLLLTAAGPSLAFGGGQRLDISLRGSNGAPEIEGLDRMATRTDYFMGARKQWRTEIPTYSRVRYRAVYPGVDVVYYGNGNVLEYDFLVAAGADPSAIRLQFQGADRVTVSPYGDLVVETAGQEVLQKKPYVYQDSASGRVAVEARYVLLGSGLAGVRVGKYDRTRPLTIDPVLVLSRYLGGTGADQVTAIKVDSKGRLCVVGSTATSDLVASDAPFNAANSGNLDIFIAVMDPTKNFAITYFSYFGGSAEDVPAAIDVDSNGFIYITGRTLSSVFPLAGTPAQGTFKGTTYNAFLAKFNPDAPGAEAMWYGTFLGGTGENSGRGIAADQQGKIYVIGTTTSSDFPVTSNAYASVLYGTQDAFLCKIDPDAGTLVYSTYLGGELTDEGRAIAVSPAGLVYFAATTFSEQFPLASASYRMTLQGVEDTIIGVMDMTLSGESSLLYATYFGGDDLDVVRKMTLDSKGRVLLTGYTFSDNFPVTADAVQTRPGGNGDVFVSLVDPAHPASFVVYSTYLGGSSGEVAYDIASDSAGSIYVAGYTLSKDFPVTPDAVQGSYGNGTEIFVAKLKPGMVGRDGLQFSTYVGGTGMHVATCLALGKDGTVYVGGYTTTGLPLAGNSPQAYGGGTTDGFLMALTDVAGQPLSLERRSAPRPARY